MKEKILFKPNGAATLERFSAIFAKEIFCDSQLAFLFTKLYFIGVYKKKILVTF